MPKLSGAEWRGDAGGVLILESEADLATILCLFFHGPESRSLVSGLMVPWDTGCRPWRRRGAGPVCAHGSRLRGLAPVLAGQVMLAFPGKRSLVQPPSCGGLSRPGQCPVLGIRSIPAASGPVCPPPPPGAPRRGARPRGARSGPCIRRAAAAQELMHRSLTDTLKVLEVLRHLQGVVSRRTGQDTPAFRPWSRFPALWGSKTNDRSRPRKTALRAA